MADFLFLGFLNGLCNGVGDEGHLFSREGEFRIRPQHIFLRIHRDQMHMHVVHFHTQHRYTYALATRSGLDTFRHFLGKGHEALELLVRQIEDIIGFRLR